MSRETWLTPFYEPWRDRFGGTPPAKVMAKVLRPLIKEHGIKLVLDVYLKWLAQQDPQYVSLPRFGQTFGTWAGGNQPQQRRPTKAEQSWQDAADWAKK